MTSAAIVTMEKEKREQEIQRAQRGMLRAGKNEHIHLQLYHCSELGVAPTGQKDVAKLSNLQRSHLFTNKILIEVRFAFLILLHDGKFKTLLVVVFISIIRLL